MGKRADLILLDADPLVDIRNTTRRSGVMVRGRWLPQAEIERRLAEIAKADGELTLVYDPFRFFTSSALVGYRRSPPAGRSSR